MSIHINSFGEGCPLVFFHGWGFDSQVWHPLIEPLAQRYQLILVDLPGFGLSSLMEWHIFKAKLLAMLPKRFVILGWSMGGLYASKLAIEAPERIISLINIASSPRFIQGDSWPGVDKELFQNFYQNLLSDTSATLSEFIALQTNKAKCQIEIKNVPSKEGLEYGLDILDKWDLRENLVSLSVPACFMFGRLDPITPIKIMNTMKVAYPNFKYVLFNKSAHMPFLSHTDLFLDEVDNFLRSE